MKIAVISIPQISPGKHNIKDSRIDLIEESFKSRTKTYAYVELIDESKVAEADVILASEDARLDLILKDLEFVTARLNQVESESEKKLLAEFKTALEKEAFLSGLILSEEDKKVVSHYGLLTLKPIFIVTNDELRDLNKLIVKVLKDTGYITFFTGNEKETRAWLIKSSTTAWEAAGKIHTDIQRGFIRAEVISSEDLLKQTSVHQAKQAGALHLVQKDYIVKDGDLLHFRFSV
jgi:ribosome-binding ATPase YchF (GTP1/OBG family)